MSIVPPLRRQVGARGGRKLGSLPGIAIGLDLVVILAVLVIAGTGRGLLGTSESGAALTPSLSWVAPTIVATWLLVLGAMGAYGLAQFGAGTDEYRNVVRATFTTSATVGIGCYLADVALSRGFFVLAFVLGAPALVVGRYALRWGLRKARRAGRFAQHTLIVGSPDHVDALASVLRRESWLGYQVVGALTPDLVEEETSAGVPVLGTSDDAQRMCLEVAPDVLVVADGAFGAPSALRQLAWDLQHHDIQVVIAPGVTDVSPERVRVRPVGGLPLMHLERPRAQHAARWMKRSFDPAVASLLVLALAPLMLLLALRIRLHDGGPVLFRQTRIGRDGRSFTCLKFRSMALDAEERLATLKDEQGFDGGLFKMDGDPRITAPGRWMRRLSLDELPQLFNVLRGEMSLIGPRPPLPSEVEAYDHVTSRRLSVLPGLTGLWQVSGRSHLTFEEAIRLDLYYVDNWSMMQDLAILTRTVRAVFSSRGAC